MKTYPFHSMAVLALTLAMAVPLGAAPQQPDTAAANAAQVDALDPAALAALDEMGKALRALPHFTVTSDATTEIVLDTGQKIQLDGKVTYKVQPPRQMFAELESDRIQRQLFYDGSTLTIFSPRLSYYASAENVGKTLGELLITAARDYGIELPLADLFFWGTEHARRDALTSAIYVGPGTLDGDSIEQYAFRQPGLDWQVWIAQDTSLPQRIVITSLDDPTMPEYAASLDWDTTGAIDPGAFAFTPPEDSARIRLVGAEVVAIKAGEEN